MASQLNQMSSPFFWLADTVSPSLPDLFISNRRAG